MNKKIFAALAIGVALSACGGSSGTIGTGVTVTMPAPTSSTPTSTPATPTPSPTNVSYSTFAALTGDQQYATACATATGASIFRRAGDISYTAATKTYRVNAPGNVTQTFAATDLVAGTVAGTTSFAKPSLTAGATERFSLVQTAPGGIALDYTRVSIGDFEGANAVRTKSYCVLGVATALGDIPAATIVTFTRLAVQGEAQDMQSGTSITYSLSSSIATMSVDLTTGVITSNLHLVGTATDGSMKDFGTFVEQGAIDTSTAGFFGSVSGTTIGSLAPRIYGGFFGPQGKEVGYVLSGVLTGSAPSNPFLSTTQLVVLGTVTGTR